MHVGLPFVTHTDAGKMEALSKENAKILQKIVEARQIDVKSRHQIVNQIRKEEERARSVRDAMLRETFRKQSRIAIDNQKFAVKLFTQKPTYGTLELEKQYKRNKERVGKISKITK